MKALMNINQQCACIELAIFGFSLRAIAHKVFGSPVASDEDSNVRTRRMISTYLSREGIRLRDWRDCKTTIAKDFANKAMTRAKFVTRTKRRKAS